MQNTDPEANYIILDRGENSRQNRLASQNLEFQVSESNEHTRLLLMKESEIPYIENIKKIDFEQFDFSDIDYLIISTSLLKEGAEAYAAYRSSNEGGNRRVGIAYVEQLYEQFAYGIKNHVIGLKNYVNYLDQINPDLKHILLLGKGMEYYLQRTNLTNRALNLVPTFGIPGSDNLLLSRPGKNQAIAPVGRVSALSNADIMNYLAKVKDFEANHRLPRTFENYAWKKNMVHLVGGSSTEQPIFESQMRFIEEYTVANKLNTQVFRNTKLSSEAVPTSVNEQILAQVNNGVVIKSFLGHGSIIVTGFGLDDPNIFDSQNRYPLDFAFGCLTGNSYTPQISVAERFVIQPKGIGSIGYIASSGYGYPFTLGQFGAYYYQLLGSTHYNRGIGDILNSVIDSTQVLRSVPQQSLSQQINLQGDPAIKLFIEDAPDFVFDFSTAKVQPEIVTTDLDSIDVAFTIANIGNGLGTDTVEVKLEHILPNDSVLSYSFVLFNELAISQKK